MEYLFYDILSKSTLSQLAFWLLRDLSFRVVSPSALDGEGLRWGMRNALPLL
jgi:hypothetical protein